MPRACPVELHDRRYTIFYSRYWIPRPWAVEASRSKLNSCKREAPRDKPVASGDFGFDSVSSQHEIPRDEPVASFDLFVQSQLKPPTTTERHTHVARFTI